MAAQNDNTRSPEKLQRLSEALLEAAGTPVDLAQIVAQSLVSANLVGHDSHGIMRLPRYVSAVHNGSVQPAARPIVEIQHQATAVVDGQKGWGQPAAQMAQKTAVSLAREYGTGAVTVHRCSHIGRLGEYVENIAREGMLGMALCNAGAVVTPFGGRDRRLGTNPFAWAAPTSSPDEPIVLDFATSAVAEGKLAVARAKGQQVPPGQIIDREGRPSTTPADFYDGGALLPFGGHKGYALSIMVEVMAGALTGTGPSCLPDYDHSNGTVIIAFNIPAFRPRESFLDQTNRFVEAIRRTRPAPGFEEVLLPGGPEAQMRRHRLAQGIPVPDQTWQEICTLAGQLGVVVEM